MILHKYKIEFIVPSTQLEPDMEAWFNQLQEAFDILNVKLHGVKFGKDTDYTKGMTILLTPKPSPPPEPPKSPEEQVKNLKIKEKV